jgi:membrane protein DedA with SNARE-associated domain
MDELWAQILAYVKSMSLWGVYLGIIIEAVFTVIPSALILGYSGYRVYLGDWNLLVVSLIASLGNLSGSFILYYLGYTFGDRVVLTVGKVIGVDKEEYMYLKKMFAKHGKYAVIVAQVIPGIRSMISVYAGVIKLNLKSLIIQTAVGGFVWCFGVITVASSLGEGWRVIEKVISKLEYAIIGLALPIIAIYAYKELKKKRN